MIIKEPTYFQFFQLWDNELIMQLQNAEAGGMQCMHYSTKLFFLYMKMIV